VFGTGSPDPSRFGLPAPNGPLIPQNQIARRASQPSRSASPWHRAARRCVRRRRCRESENAVPVWMRRCSAIRFATGVIAAAIALALGWPPWRRREPYRSRRATGLSKGDRRTGSSTSGISLVDRIYTFPANRHHLW